MFGGTKFWDVADELGNYPIQLIGFPDLLLLQQNI